MNQELENQIFSCLLESSQRFLAEHGTEELYSLSLYTCGEYSYVGQSFSTAEGLKEVAETYLAKDYYRSQWGTIQVGMQDLKWSPCDSPRHLLYEEQFESANALLEQFWEDAPEGSDQEWLDSCKLVHEAMSNALKRLIAKGLFDQNEVVFNILMGDQSDEARLLNAEPLNTDAVLKRFRSDLTIDQSTLESLRESRWLWPE